jgi:hypothetical protein
MSHFRIYYCDSQESRIHYQRANQALEFGPNGVLGNPFCRRRFDTYAYCHFDTVFTSGFWSTIRSIASRLSESYVALVNHGQFHEETFIHNVACAIEFDPRLASGDEYLLSLTTARDGTIDNVQLLADSVSMHGESLDWCLYGDRGIELAVFAHRSDHGLLSNGSHCFFGLDQAIENVLPLAIRDPLRLAEASDLLRSSYPHPMPK